MTVSRSAPLRPGDAAVRGPLAAASVRLETWTGQHGVHLLYADLDLMEVAALRRALGLPATGAETTLLTVAQRERNHPVTLDEALEEAGPPPASEVQVFGASLSNPASQVVSSWLTPQYCVGGSPETLPGPAIWM